MEIQISGEITSALTPIKRKQELTRLGEQLCISTTSSEEPVPSSSTSSKKSGENNKGKTSN